MLAQGRILVDGIPAQDARQFIDEFTRVTLDGNPLQARTPTYLMLHKPVGVVSATKDAKHKTVIDLLDRTDSLNLHIVGRLDFNSSGLVLLTNDGRWSRRLTSPEQKVIKQYSVALAKPITEEYVKAFAEGMYFPFEGITTRPAQLEILGESLAKVSLTEGRYHQIKRMFGRFQNQVLSLHRTAVGNLYLDPALAPGQNRELTPAEVLGITTE
jgi:16S rRNA pseudouridine516 synthase